MEIKLERTGKKYNRSWIFRNLNFHLNSFSSLAIVGSNGSGKSTLLQMIYGYQSISEGSIHYFQNGNEIADENWYAYTSFAAPYLDLPEEFTLDECWEFHFKAKPIKSGFTKTSILLESNLAGNEKKLVRYFSSGMKQRLKLIFAIFSDTPVLLLDEPCTNLDKAGIIWYRKLLLNEIGRRTLVIASNQLDEYDFCANRIEIQDFKS